MRLSASVATLSLLVMTTLGCGRAEATAAPASSSKAAVSAQPGGGPVSQIVFIDKEKCCECTKNRTDATWKEMQTALGANSDVQVVRVHLDTQPELAKEYLNSKPLMVPPGLYFMSAKGDLVEMLQGELTAPQISAVLKK